MARISVVVPSFRRTDGLRRLVEALDRQSIGSDTWELVVVDDASGPPWTDQIDEVVAASRAHSTVIHLPANGGPAVARNRGWQAGTGEVIAFTDDDCQPHPLWLEAGLAAIEADDGVGIVQGPTVRPPGSEHHRSTHLTVVREVLQPSPWFEGCNLFLRRSALEEAGGFDEQLVVFGEETTLGWKAMELGWRRAWAADAVVAHEVCERSWRWHLRIHFLEQHLVYIAARHPGIRSSFWRPWAVKRENALFALAVLGLLASAPHRRLRGLAVLAGPYLLWLIPPWRPPRVVGALHQITVHAASLAGKASAWIPARTFLL